MEDGVVVAELDVVRPHRLTLVVRTQDLTTAKDFGDEHSALSLRRGREEVQVLPDGAANGARNADVVLEAGPAQPNRLEDEVLHDGAAFAPELSVLVKNMVPG